MVRMLTSGVVECWLEPWLGQTKDDNISMRCFSSKHAALSKDWLAGNQDNVS